MKITCESRKATRIKINVHGDVQDYAMSFLAIYNNVKASHDLLKMYNNYDNDIYVICETDVEDATKQFLEQFGTIESCEQVLVFAPYCDQLNYPDDIDIEFLDIEE